MIVGRYHPQKRGVTAHDRWRPGSGAAEAGEGLGQDGLAVGVAAALLHVSQVRLVRLDAGRVRRGLLVLARGIAATGALPRVRDRRVRRETRTRLVPVSAPERDPDARRGFAALGLSHRTRADPAAADGVATTHRSPLEGHRAMKPELRCGITTVRDRSTG